MIAQFYAFLVKKKAYFIANGDI